VLFVPDTSSGESAVMSLNFDFLTSVSAGGLAREQPEVDAAEPDALGC
jgi:hypothetical protein